MKITVDGVVCDVVKEKEINGCRGCFLDGFCCDFEECKKITNINCIKEKVIFLKVPDSLKNCHNCKFYTEYDCSDCKNYDKGGKRMILNILFFIAWTVIVLRVWDYKRKKSNGSY